MISCFCFDVRHTILYQFYRKGFKYNKMYRKYFLIKLSILGYHKQKQTPQGYSYSKKKVLSCYCLFVNPVYDNGYTIMVVRCLLSLTCALFNVDFVGEYIKSTCRKGCCKFMVVCVLRIQFMSQGHVITGFHP